MQYKILINLLKKSENDIYVKFKGDNGWFCLFCEPREYYYREVKSMEILVDGERICDEIDEELYNKEGKIHKTDAIHIMLY